MDKVLLVSVIALAVALLSMLVNLALVWKISDLKHQIEWLERGPIDDLKYHLTTNMDKVTKLENDTKDAFDIVTNNLKLHGTLLDEMSTKFALLDGRVSKHTKQLEDLGNFAGITTGELRVLEQKIYKASQLPPEPEPISKQIEESIALCHKHTDQNNFELNRFGERLSVVEIKLTKAFEEFNRDLKTIQSSVVLMQKDVLTRYNELNFKIKGICPHELDEDIRKVKPDRKRKDNYYRRPNKQQVIYDEFADDIMK